MKSGLITLLLLLSISMYSQNYEVYTGAVISEDKDMHTGYMLGANFIIKTNQNRDYLNNLILGFEHSAFMSGNNLISSDPSIDNPIQTACNCKSEILNPLGSSDLSIKKEVRAVSLNFGVELCNECWFKNLYLMTGVTNFQHIMKVNNEKVTEYRTMQIDAGIKYFVKANHWTFSPTFKFNPETINFGLGFSYQ